MVKAAQDGPGAGKKQEALQDALSAIEKTHGKGSIMRLGDDVREPIDGISTGSLGLDLAVGGRGMPRGRVVEIFGPESSGKTTLTLHVIAAAQRSGGMAAFIDAEHALDPQYAKKLGVDLDALLISQPDNGEQALDICETLVRSAAIDIIVIDSVAALVPRAEIEGDMGDTFVGLQARLMSQALRKLTALVAKTGTLLIFINQIREKIGVMFGSPETTTGGRALKFYSSVRIDIRRIGYVKNGDVAIGARTKATVVKNKVAPPFRKVEFDIIFNEGINQLGEILDMGVEQGVLKRSGTWLSYGDIRLGQGRDRAREFLLENRETAIEIRQKILEILSPELVRSSTGKSAPDAAKPGGDPEAAGETSEKATSRSSGSATAGASAATSSSGSSSSGSSSSGTSSSGSSSSGGSRATGSKAQKGAARENGSAARSN